jgi:hypothetical protein
MRMGHILENDVLAVELADPEECGGVRFDRTGFITQVRLKRGGHTFCTRERPEPGAGTGGAGICGEFGLFTPVGYDSAAVGQRFPKLGVGLLTRLDGSDYDFRAAYPADLFAIRTEIGERHARYAVEPKACRGYAAKLEKRIRIDGASLIIDYALHNVGTEPIVTEEYTHNFLAVDGLGPGPAYRLAFAMPVRLDAMEPAYTPRIVDVTERELRFRREPEQDIYCAFEVPPAAAAGWELVHEPTGVGLREICRFEAARLAVWGAPHVLSPEVFIALWVMPGERKTWRRVYEFFRFEDAGG